ncbi:MAG: bifunctional 2',3'-cyclic-nucleotide 2'-phosphodiesterase/3'-nucleotidase [Pseudomonadota bacterium]
MTSKIAKKTRGFSTALTQHPFAKNGGQEKVHLRILSTTDLHAYLYPYDYYADAPVDTVGLSRIASHVAVARTEAANSLLVDNGDFLQGNPLGDLAAKESGAFPDAVHPVVAAMNVVGYDVGTLGNHDFNYGLDVLQRAIAQSDFPFVSANAVTEMGRTGTDDRTLVPPFILLDRTLTDGAGKLHEICVGVTGFLPPQTAQWDRRQLEGKLAVRDIVESARTHVAAMKNAGADIVIALSHSGIGPDTAHVGMENASAALAQVPGIDAIVAGHQHMIFPGPDVAKTAGVDPVRGMLFGKPATMAGALGSHLGVIDLLLEQSGDGWRVGASDAAVRPIAEKLPNGRHRPLIGDTPEVLSSAAAAHDATLAFMRRPIGRTAVALHSFFAAVAEARSVQIVAIAQRDYVRRALRGTEHEQITILSAAAPFRAGGRGGADHFTYIPAGELTQRHAADLYIYPNTIQAVKVTGVDLARWLERSASVFEQIVPGVQDQVLLTTQAASYNFDVIYGVRYQIDLTQPPVYASDGKLLNGGVKRIVDLTFEGAPVTDDMEFVVATNNYRADGGGAFPIAAPAATVFRSPEAVRDILVRHITAKGEIAAMPFDTWRFCSVPNTSVIYDSSPLARAFVDELPHVKISKIGEGPGGFARFRIDLG